MALPGARCNHPTPIAPSNMMTNPPSTPETPPASRSLRVLVTAGPTWEPVDDVRYLGNRSSGRLGAELARAAGDLGHLVTLLRGPGTIDPSPHPRISEIRFQSATDLDQELRNRWPAHDLLVMAAAVADFRPVRIPDAPRKIRRSDGTHSLELEPVPDLLAGLAELEHPEGTRVGFALEPTEDLLKAARAKLVRKNLHAIVANPLETMDSERILGTLLVRDGTEARPPAGSMSKSGFAEWLIARLVELHRSRVDGNRDR